MLQEVNNGGKFCVLELCSLWGIRGPFIGLTKSSRWENWSRKTWTGYFRVHQKFLDPRRTTKSCKNSSQNILERRPEIVPEISGPTGYFRPKDRNFRTPENIRNTNTKMTITFASGLRFRCSWARWNHHNEHDKIMQRNIIVQRWRMKPIVER